MLLIVIVTGLITRLGIYLPGPVTGFILGTLTCSGTGLILGPITGPIMILEPGPVMGPVTNHALGYLTGYFQKVLELCRNVPRLFFIRIILQSILLNFSLET